MGQILMNSTLRFLALPSGVVFGETGSDSPFAIGLDAVACDAKLIGQCISHRGSPSFGEVEVFGIIAVAVGMADNFNFHGRIFFQCFGYFAKGSE
jgi:hypothetical protein